MPINCTKRINKKESNKQRLLPRFSGSKFQLEYRNNLSIKEKIFTYLDEFYFLLIVCDSIFEEFHLSQHYLFHSLSYLSKIKEKARVFLFIVFIYLISNGFFSPVSMHSFIDFSQFSPSKSTYSIDFIVGESIQCGITP